MRDKPETGRGGEGVSVVVVDTGLTEDADAGHPWLEGVRGAPEDTYVKLDGQNVIAPYAGHGMFVAGVARCVALGATVYVERAFTIAGAAYESSLLHSLEHALGLNPDVLVLPFTTSTRGDLSPLTFDDLFERHVGDLKGLVMLAAVGNDRAQRLMWPARVPRGDLRGCPGDKRARACGLQQLRSVGRCLRAGRRPHQRLSGQEPTVYQEPPRAGTSAQFDGMAIWGGTSFAVPIRRRARRGPDVRHRGERAAGGGFAAALRLQSGNPRSRCRSLSRSSGG